LCRQIAKFRPARLVLLEWSEFALYQAEQEFRRELPGLTIACAVGDVKDRERIRHLLSKYRPHVIFHAAAYKHVPLMEEENAWEAVRNNVHGTCVLASEAAGQRVGKFVLISTDKAVNPVNVMGASKRLAEMVCQALQRPDGTRFVMVRFGNVLGSAGSVVPLFKEQIARGGPVTVTHPECRRYLMTIPEAVGLVLLAGLGGHGELLILEMGEPILILDLARMMISLSGRVPEKDIPIVITGLRPGEKLDEELLTAEEAARSREVRPKVRAVQSPPPPPDLLERIGRLEALARAGDRDGVLAALREVVPSFTPAQPVAGVTPSGSR
jgi:FlaA1/EpsC-like NDP-sugar epimerase